MDVNIYPNPSSGKVFVCGTEEGTTLSVYNHGGEEIHRSLLARTHSIIDLSAQPEGVYFMELRSSVKVDLRKIALANSSKR